MQENTTVRVYRYRLYPTKSQEAAMFETLRLTRLLYNAALEQRREAYRKHGKTLSAYDQQKELTALKSECPEFSGVYSHVLQDVFDRLDKAYKAFFSRVKKGAKRAGFPRFKPRQRWDSFKFKQCWNNKRSDWTACGRPVDDGQRISIPKIGAVKCKFHRPLEGKPKSLQIVHDCGQWFAVYACEVPMAPLPATGSSVGLDLGTTWFAVTSDGEFIENPRYLGNSLKKLRVQQRTVSRRKKGGHRRRKAVQQVAKTHRKVRRQRLDFQHKTARRLVNEHDLIAHENLQVGNMAQSNLARSILDAGWAGFLFQLSSKAESAGRRVIAVDPRYTSQRCNACGRTGKENRVNQATFRCVQCGHTANADHNAAKNILRSGLLMRVRSDRLGRAVPSAENGSGVSHVVV